MKKSKKTAEYAVILVNDDKNSFEGVIKSLALICNHNILQAEQCANIVHHSGECYVKEHLSYDEAEKISELLIGQGLSAKIDVSE